MYERIPLELKQDSKWVCARTERKVPLRADTLLAAAVSSPNTWSTYDKAYANVVNKKCDYVGYVFNGNGIVGVDLDHSFVDGILTDKALEIIDRFKSYTEISKSGNGIHILVRGKLPFTGSNNRVGVEVYSTGRFFILTGNVIAYDEIIENQDALDWLVSEHFNTIRISSGQKQFKKALYTKDVHVEGSKIHICYPKITPGSRNSCLTSYAGKLRGKGYSADEIAAKVHFMNKTKCEPPLPYDEIENIIKSIMKYSNLPSVGEG